MSTYKKGFYFGCLPEKMSLEEKFRLLKESGYDGIEIPTMNTKEAKRLKDEAEEVGIEIHSIMNSLHWEFPLSDPLFGVRNKGIKNIFEFRNRE